MLKTRAETESFIGMLRERTFSAAPKIERTVRKILDDVRKNGDEAVLKYTRRFDDPFAERLAFPPRDVARHAAKADKTVVSALETAAARIRAFHERQRESSWSFSEAGTILGQLITPLRRVGVYVPGGKASYPSTVLMNVIPAQVAGVDEIALCVPMPKGEVNPSVMAAIRMLGVREVYGIGGAQAIAAMSFGTETVQCVDKIVGPGNVYVATAKRMVFGHVDIDMIAGPSEILIIADDSAAPAFVAADLLSQAEHDEYASSILVTSSRDLAKSVRKEVEKQLIGLTRARVARKSLERYGAIVVTESLEEATDIANQIAPEHLEIMTRYPKRLVRRIRNAGAIFLGRWTPEAVGDYAAGPNHTLPTGGTARFSSPLGVYDFIKRSSLLMFSRRGLMRLADTVTTISMAEGLDAHGNSIRVRIQGKEA